MNNSPSDTDSSFLADSCRDIAPDLDLLYGEDSDDLDSSSDFPATPVVNGNPRPSSFVRRTLPAELFGISPSQFACGCSSVASNSPCRLRVCMLFRHHQARAIKAGVPVETVVRCSVTGCRFVAPCFSHFVSTVSPTRADRRARYAEYFGLVRHLVLAGTLSLPPPLPALLLGINVTNLPAFGLNVLFPLSALFRCQGCEPFWLSWSWRLLSRVCAKHSQRGSTWFLRSTRLATTLRQFPLCRVWLLP